MSDTMPVVVYNQDGSVYRRHNVDRSRFGDYTRALAPLGRTAVPDPEGFLARAREGRPVGQPERPAPTPPSPAPPSPLSTFARSAANTGLLGWADEAEGAIRSLGDETYGEAVESVRRAQAAGAEANPMSHYGGIAAGLAPHIMAAIASRGRSVPAQVEAATGRSLGGAAASAVARQAAQRAAHRRTLATAGAYGATGALGDVELAPTSVEDEGGEQVPTSLPRAVLEAGSRPREAAEAAGAGLIGGVVLGQGANLAARGVSRVAAPVASSFRRLMQYVADRAPSARVSASVGRQARAVGNLSEGQTRRGMTHHEGMEELAEEFRDMGMHGAFQTTDDFVRVAEGSGARTGRVLGQMVDDAERAGARYRLSDLEARLRSGARPTGPEQTQALDALLTDLRAAATTDPITGEAYVSVRGIHQARREVGRDIGRRLQTASTQEIQDGMWALENQIYSVMRPIQNDLLVSSGAVGANRAAAQGVLSGEVAPVAARAARRGPPPLPPGGRPVSDTVPGNPPTADTIRSSRISDTIRDPAAADTIAARPVSDTARNVTGAPTVVDPGGADTMTNVAMAADMDIVNRLNRRHFLSATALRGLRGRTYVESGQSPGGLRGFMAGGGMLMAGGGPITAGLAAAGGVISRATGPAFTASTLEAVLRAIQSRPSQVVQSFTRALGPRRGEALFQVLNRAVNTTEGGIEGEASDHFTRFQTDPEYRAAMNQAQEDLEGNAPEHKTPGTWHHYTEEQE